MAVNDLVNLLLPARADEQEVETLHRGLVLLFGPSVELDLTDPFFI